MIKSFRRRLVKAGVSSTYVLSGKKNYRTDRSWQEQTAHLILLFDKLLILLQIIYYSLTLYLPLNRPYVIR